MARDQEFIEKSIVAKIIAEAWKDAAFKARLLAHPADVLRERGMTVRPGVSVVVVEDTATTVHMILPAMPEVANVRDLDHPEQFVTIYTFTQIGPRPGMAEGSQSDDAGDEAGGGSSSAGKSY